ncbi:3'(2'),5'-bisphosphate nucleotidase CysQ [Aquabacter cavernae]|uniref:3'(2'),5'-bisphosphate nucleotidase CysQ n=1 Tax=Aquabacter cavernae TaxID=2496029 RepID=UPI003B847E6D
MLADLEHLALAAGREVLAVYGTDFTVEQKADASSVTQADTRAEAVILDGLARLAPGVPVVAEEQVAAGHCPRATPLFFLVDPLDGTREFVSRNGEFTVNIALIEDSIPVLGVVYAPALGILYAGAAGHGAHKRTVGDELGAPQRIGVNTCDVSGVRAIASRSHADGQTGAWLDARPIASLCSAGSSLKFGLLAEGAADVYPRFGRTMEWDTAAGDAVLRAAGGGVVTLDGAPLRYGKDAPQDDAPYANPFFIAFGDRRVLDPAPARAG